MQTTNKNFIFFLAIWQVTVLQVGWFLYMPSLPHMVTALHTSISTVQLTAAFYSFSLCISQLFYGPISDHFGRRPMLLVGLIIYVLGSFIAATAHTIDIVLFARVLQGVGGGACSTFGRAIPRDIFTGHEYRKRGSQVAIMLSVLPLITPIVGGYLQHLISWRAPFTFMLLYSTLLWIAVSIWLPETNPHLKQEIFAIKTIAKNYWHIMRNKRFLAFLLVGGLTLAGEVAYMVVAPFLFQVRLHFSVVQYGWLSLYTVSGFVIGAFISQRLIAHLSYLQLICVGLVLVFLGGLSMLVLAGFNYIAAFNILIPMVVYMMGLGFIYPNSNIGALSDLTKNVGIASAFFSSSQQICSALSSTLMSHLHVRTAVPLGCVLVGLSLLASLLFYFLNKGFNNEKSYAS